MSRYVKTYTSGYTLSNHDFGMIYTWALAESSRISDDSVLLSVTSSIENNLQHYKSMHLDLFLAIINKYIHLKFSVVDNDKHEVAKKLYSFSYKLIIALSDIQDFSKIITLSEVEAESFYPVVLLALSFVQKNVDINGKELYSYLYQIKPDLTQEQQGEIKIIVTQNQ